jgi:F-type H+-transporting ATPase subunit delta
MAEAELTTVARPYARAAFSQALDESEGLVVWGRMLALAAAAVNVDSVKTLLADPRLTTDQEAGVLLGLLGDDLSRTGRNFITLLARYGRITLLPHIATIYEQLRAQYEKTMDVSITSAFDVEAADKEKLTTALGRRLQREVTLTTAVDPTLLGGLIIRTDNTVIDNSVRGKLEKLSQALS